jgi:hypothetical protein
MRKYPVLSMFSALLFLFATAFVWAAEGAKEKAKPEYVGAKKCKACHKAEHKSWLETKHAKAFDVLSVEEKKKAECVGCHITGKTAKGELLEGIQCEACHGPGSGYKSAKVMSKKKWAANPDKHKKMAVEAGLVHPTEKECKRCHKKEGNPNFKKFDFAKKKLLVHEMKSDSTSAKKASTPAPASTVEAKKSADTTSKK